VLIIHAPFIEDSGATCQGQWYPKAIQGVGANRDEEMSNEFPVLGVEQMRNWIFCLVVSSIFWNFHPENWGNDPI